MNFEDFCSQPEYGKAFLEDAWAQYESAVAIAQSCTLDEKTTHWIVNANAWLQFKRSPEFSNMVMTTGDPQIKKLFDIPVRLTIDDAEDMPEIVLMMEPMLYAQPNPGPLPIGLGRR